eukprot:gene29405-38498_t
MVRLGDVSPTIWDKVVERMEEKLISIEFQEEDILIDWRVLANKRKFNRELFEKYGFLKDVILHPRFQYVKQLLEDQADFRLFVSDPVLPWTTAIIILSMMYKRVNLTAMFLIAAFIFSLNPVYVVMLALFWGVLSLSSKSPKLHLPIKKKSRSVGEGGQSVSTLTSEKFDTTFDHVLIGNDLSTLYTAALLARNNHRCCVLQPTDGAVMKVSPEGCPFPVYLQNLTVGKIEQYQSLIDAGQSLQKGRRVTFSPIGSDADGFSSSILRIAGNAEGKKSAVGCLRAGEMSLATDLSGRFAVDRTTLAIFIAQLKINLAHLTSFLMSRTAKDATAVTATDGYKLFAYLAETSSDQAISQGKVDSEVVSDLLAQLGTVSSGESLSAEESSAFNFADAILTAETGAFYPNGSFPALEQAFLQTIRAADGVVFQNVDLKELLFEEVGAASGASLERRVRVTGARVQVSPETEVDVSSRRAVVSGVGLLNTYLKLVPAEAVSTATKTALAELREKKPVVTVVYWLRDPAEALGLSATDYVEVGSGVNKSPSLDTLVAGKSKSSHTSWIKVWSPSAKDASWSDSHSEDIQVVIVEFSVPDSLVALKKFSFSNNNNDSVAGPSVYVSRAATAEDAYKLNVELSFSKSKREKSKHLADEKLKELYPLAVGKEVFSFVQPPVLGGSYVSSTTAKFTAKYSCVSDVENLYFTGRDMGSNGLAGDIQSGWLAANAILG